MTFLLIVIAFYTASPDLPSTCWQGGFLLLPALCRRGLSFGASKQHAVLEPRRQSGGLAMWCWLEVACFLLPDMQTAPRIQSVCCCTPPFLGEGCWDCQLCGEAASGTCRGVGGCILGRLARLRPRSSSWSSLSREALSVGTRHTFVPVHLHAGCV